MCLQDGLVKRLGLARETGLRTGERADLRPYSGGVKRWSQPTQAGKAEADPNQREV